MKDRTAGNYTMHNKVKLVRGGKEYFDLLEGLINNAHTTVHLQTYIFNEDHTGNRIIHTLIGAAGRGVQVFVVLDGYASRNISKSCI